MSHGAGERPPKIVYQIKDSGMTIYDGLDDEDELFLAIEQLERILKDALKGQNLDYPLRTRSKVVKEAICRALGYPVPARFQKTKPRFPGQNFDTYIQKSNNLQIWNEEISSSRRYALIRVNQRSIVTDVKVVTGLILARLDKTGTLTQKFQAKSREAISQSVLCVEGDTSHLQQRIALVEAWNKATFGSILPTELPIPGRLLPIATLFEMLLALVGEELIDPGLDQERNRGAELHRRVCGALGYRQYQDQGQFPDVMNQLLEIKLQTSPTIDLGLVTPDSTEPIAEAPQVRHCDVRYSVFYGAKTTRGIRLDHLVLTTGEEFFHFFQRFEGRVVNKKLQIPLPADFFDETE